VAKNSPGDQIGLRGSKMLVNLSGSPVPLGGDVILTVGGISMTAANASKIRDALGHLPSGTPFKVTILRAGQVLELTGKAQ
jgi:S1-C subfamily serine protease